MQWYFGQECHFNNIFYITILWYKFFEEIEQFFEKGVNLVVNLGKMTIGFRSILVVNSEKNNNLFWKSKFFGYVSFTGKSENLVETAILKDFFIFVANGHHFQKC